MIALVLMLGGCDNIDTPPASGTLTNDARLAGSWRQIRLNRNDVSDRDIKLIITERSLTMEAPGCLISGEYSAAEDLITFKISVAEGEQCAPGQDSGQSQSTHYQISGSQLTLTQKSAGQEIQTVFERAGGEQAS